MPSDRPDLAGVPRIGLRPPEAAAALGVSERTLWRWSATEGGPPCYRVGGVVLYPADALADWLRDRADAE